MDDFIIRNIEISDYEQYMKHISSMVDKDFFTDFITLLSNDHQIKVLVVNGIIIGSGTILIEYKLTYGGCKLAHVENILIDENYRGKGFATILIDHLLTIANEHICYRVDLICSDDLITFYSKQGFTNKQNALSILFPENYNI